MLERLREYWLPRLLFLVTLGIAAGLAGLVALGPTLHEEFPSEAWLRLFAADAAVRRTSIASSIGLAVTAFVFFRPHGVLFARKPRARQTPKQMAGA